MLIWLLTLHVMLSHIPYILCPPPRPPFQRIFQCKIAYSNIEPLDACRYDMCLCNFDNGKCPNWKSTMRINVIPLPT